MDQAGFQPFEELEHPADISLRVYGDDLAALFRHAAQGMFHLLRCRADDDPDSSEPVTEEIVLQAHDVETLLVDWLTELLYLSETRQACFDTFDLTHIDPTHLKAVVRGVSPARAEKDIKAVTYADMSITRNDDDHYTTTITFDV
ncbi:MAG TPA: archease [Chloroflexi bacterium]|jgi:SHS2 domain-containing protein|nr:archease [Chloroflexota bacterium]